LNYRVVPTNGAATQDRPSSESRTKAMIGRIMMCSRCRVRGAGAYMFDTRESQTFKPPGRPFAGKYDWWSGELTGRGSPRRGIKAELD